MCEVNSWFGTTVGVSEPLNRSVTNCVCEGRLTVTKCGNVTVSFSEAPRAVDSWLNGAQWDAAL